MRVDPAYGMGVDHAAYQTTLDPVPAGIRASLLRDLQG
jgi:hypothetical protein